MVNGYQIKRIWKSLAIEPTLKIIRWKQEEKYTLRDLIWINFAKQYNPEDSIQINFAESSIFIKFVNCIVPVSQTQEDCF
jgi:hypothetical protein